MCDNMEWLNFVACYESFTHTESPTGALALLLILFHSAQCCNDKNYHFNSLPCNWNKLLFGQCCNWRWCYQQRIESLFGRPASDETFSFSAASYSGCLVMPIKKLPNREDCGPNQNIVRQKIRIDRLTNGRTFPSDAVMFLRCRLHGGASSSNSLCPQQLHLQLLPPSPSVSVESSFPPATSSPTLRLPLPPSDGLCWCCGCLFHRMTPQRRMPWVTTAVRACLLPQSLLLPSLPLVDTECWSGQAGLWLVRTIQLAPHWSIRPPPDWLEMQKCTEKQQSSFRRLGPCAAHSVQARPSELVWGGHARWGGAWWWWRQRGGLSWSERDRERKAMRAGEKMHIVMFPNDGKEVRISRLA